MQRHAPLCLFVVLILIIAGSVNPANAILRSGEQAPAFALKDLKGNSFALQDIKSNPVTVLFFFDATSRASQQALMTLDKLAQDYKEAGLIVWGITRSEHTAVQDFLAKAGPKFPVLLDDGAASGDYNAKLILPVTCTLAPGLKILDYYQGGGKTIENMMISLAERQLNRKQTMLAKAISDEVSSKNPDSVEAAKVKGYAALKNGELDQASKVFSKLAKKKGDAGVAGKEGQAAVLARQGKTDQALALVEEVERKAPKRSYANVIKGDLLASQGKTNEAGKAYELAAAGQDAAPFQQAEAMCRLGQFEARAGNLEQARNYYDQAVDLDPYYLEPTSNKGVTYEKQGQWDQALKEYRKALDLNASDTIAAALARKAEEMLALSKDQQRSQRVDKLVKDLAQRFKEQRQSAVKPEDTWTSRPMVISFIDFQEKGGMAPREGMAGALVTQLGDLLNASGRVRVVERALLERLLEELNLGSSELADQATALQLGRVLAAKLISTGSLFYLPNTTMLNLRLIDAETTAVPKSFTKSLNLQADLDRTLFDLNRELLSTIIQQYPLRGYVVQASDDTVMLNLGADQGVVQGSRFSVVEAAQPIVYKGRTLNKAPEVIGRLEVVSVEPDLCQARIISKQRAFKTDDKVQEMLEDGQKK